jgi:oligoendopeptidase F
MSPAAAPSAPIDRAAIPAHHKWDFSPIFPDWNAWEQGLKALEAKMGEFAARKGTLANGPAAVLGAYRLHDEVGMLQYRVYGYTQLQRDVDTRDQLVAGKLQRVQALSAKFGAATAWFTPELLAVPQAEMEKWIAETPALGLYRFTILDAYRQQKHVLDEKGEKLLSYAAPAGHTPAAVYQELSTSDIKFPVVKFSDGREVRLTPAAYQAALLTCRGQADRALAFEAYYKTYAAAANTYAAIYHGVLQRDWFLAQARDFPTTLETALEANDIPPGVVHNLVEAVRGGTAPLQRYLRLRRKLLGLETYHLYDNAIPIFDADRKYPYEEAVPLVISSVAPLGADYQEKYRQFTSGGRIDVDESAGKRSGAYSMGVYGVGPYLLLNYNDTLDAVFTFAHEAGHAMHTILAYENQPFVTSDYTIFVAEVASTINERFLLEKLLDLTADPKERFLLIQHAADAILGTFYTQVFFADFELQAHRLVEQGQPVTAGVLNGLYGQLLHDYYGDAVAVDELSLFTWTRIPHFYHAPYYVYQYATCFASSAQLFKEMTAGRPADRAAAVARYLDLLKSGGSDYPMKQLRRAGVDLARREAVQAVIDQMDELVSRLEAEAARID